MLRFKQFLIEGVVRSVGRKIFVEPPSPLATAEFTNPLYNQIVTRPEPIKFDAFDKDLQASWRSPREKLIASSDGAWDFMDVGSKNIDDVRGLSPSYKEGKTFKGYYSLADIQDPEVVKKFGAAVPDLHRRLAGVADQLGTSFSFKVPKHTKSVGEHVDSIVFHHYDVPDSSLHRSIDATTRQWAKDNGLELLDRQGMDTGVDIKGEGSFSEQLAKRIARGEKGSISEIGKQILDNALVKTTGKTVLKSIPFVGTAASIAAMADRAQAGDYVGAGLEAASEVADYIPGVGTAASLGIQTHLADRDMSDEERKKAVERRSMQALRSIQPPSF
jgi:hypothetical protein